MGLREPAGRCGSFRPGCEVDPAGPVGQLSRRSRRRTAPPRCGSRSTRSGRRGRSARADRWTLRAPRRRRPRGRRCCDGRDRLGRLPRRACSLAGRLGGRRGSGWGPARVARRRSGADRPPRGTQVIEGCPWKTGQVPAPDAPAGTARPITAADGRPEAVRRRPAGLSVATAGRPAAANRGSPGPLRRAGNSPCIHQGGDAPPRRARWAAHHRQAARPTAPSAGATPSSCAGKPRGPQVGFPGQQPPPTPGTQAPDGAGSVDGMVPGGCRVPQQWRTW